MTLDAHPRKTLQVRWHTSVENVMATCSVDKTIKIWDINEDRADEPVFTYMDLSDMATSLRWNPDGKTLASVCKNKSVVIVDPRTQE
jgi:WD40 repeat protein|mmetsp:Transcript_21649/g.29003  ORF Transcript_21649/g.29003 Transcript_21649/m.29003 type:complete len:87 (+) Transcript_21649:359-619(+)